MKLVVLVVSILSIATMALGMDVPVAVDATSADSVGKRLMYRIKEEINASSSMHVTLGDEAGLGLGIVTLEGDHDSPGNYTTYSVTWTWVNPEQPWPYYLASSVGVCGTSRVDEVAEGIVADTQETWESLFKTIREVIESE